MVHHARTTWVFFDIAESDPEMAGRHRTGVIPCLPQVPAASFPDIQGLSESAVGSAEKEGQGILPIGDDDEVYVIGHEAVSEDPTAGLWEVLADQAEVQGAVGIGKENPLSVGAALCNVVGKSW
jgi:hypothetical protein